MTSKFVAYCFVVLFVMPLMTMAQEEIIEVDIPDPALRAVIEMHLGIESDDVISTMDMEYLSYIDANFLGAIHSLSGLEHAVNLVELAVHGNNIESIEPIAELTQLHRLFLGLNPIADFTPLSNLTNLLLLSLEHTGGADISALAGLNSLGWLNLEDNNISDISALAGLNSLGWLNLEDNNISDITPLVQNTGLVDVEINLQDNPLNDMALTTHIPALERRGVTVRFGVIYDPALRTAVESVLGKRAGDIITASDMKKLTVLEVPDRGISVVYGLNFATNLRELNLNGNNLRTTAGLNQLHNLTILKLDNNSDGIWLPHLTELTNLKELWLRNNAITDFTPLSQLTNLETLRLRGNSMRDISALAGLTNLTSLSVSGNPIEDVTPLSELTELQHLWVQEIPISDISFVENLTNLRSLWLRNNAISDISSLTKLTNLIRLGLNGNRITDISPLVSSRLHRLDRVNLNGNPLSTESIEVHIPVLKDRGVTVIFEPRKLPENPEDVNGDGRVTVDDLILVAAFYGQTAQTAPEEFVIIDVNGDGVVDIDDLIAVANALEDADDIAAAPQILESFLPRETILLANYPNPFNPETWIPYQLAQPADVRITIYAANGAPVRTLDVGYQTAGLYLNRSGAAYWDGKNAYGQPVSSGVYFYTLTARDFAATRKMLILK